MPRLLTQVEESQLTLDAMHSLPRISVQPTVPPVLPLKLALRIQLKLDVLKEQTDYVSMLYQLDRLLEFWYVD